jgi:RND family efflux transporter MFP subunit
MLASRQVAVERARAELAQAETQLVQRRRDYERQEILQARNAGTDEALETAETDLQVAKARVRELTVAIAAAEAAVGEVQQAIANMHIYAPFDGTVVAKDAEVGETIMPGGMGLASGRGSVVTLADLDALEVDTDVKEDYLAQIWRGQPAEVVVDAVSGHPYRGRVREIIPLGDRTRGIVKVKVRVVDADERLFPDLSATVHFLPRAYELAGGDAKQATYVPAQAVVAADGSSRVWRIEGQRAFATVVEPLGEAKDGLVPIAETPELAGGDKLIVDPPAGLADGTRVEARE